MSGDDDSHDSIPGDESHAPVSPNEEQPAEPTRTIDVPAANTPPPTSPPPSRTGDSFSRTGESYSRTTGGTTRRRPPVPKGATLELYGDRYEDHGILGIGGMGEVRRAYDRLLDRTLAVKVMRADRVGDPRSRKRFLEEARINARLQHPGIVAVHDRGELPDGRPWFAMRRIRGRTLDAIMAAHFRREPGAPPRRRLIEALTRVARTVAYAHVHRVLHRDLKPANVMIGEFGEVLVLDWGIAHLDEIVDAEGGPISDRQGGTTIGGRIVGTPAYMSPEQARGDRDAMGTHSDVYALGAILYHMLAGKPPYGGRTATAHAALLAGPPVPLAERDLPAPLPPDLADLCARAMSRDATERPTAEHFANELEIWLDGLRKRARATELVAEADAMRPQVEALRAEVEVLRRRAAAILDPLPDHAPIEDKRPGWALEDEGQGKSAEAQLIEVRMLQTLRAALNVVPDLPAAHDRLAAYYRREVDAAEAERDFTRAAVFEELVRSHDRGAHAEWLAGDGAVTLVTDPPGARVRHYRFEEVDRRLAEVEVRPLGTTPLHRATLPRGSHLLVIERDGHRPVRYPVHIGRGEHWDGIRPGDADPTPITLPPIDALEDDDCYVPPGWARIGGDHRAADALPRQWIWVDGFIIKRFPVTNAEYIAFLESLSPAERARFIPGDATSSSAGRLYEERSDGRLVLPADGLFGWQWGYDWPVALVDHACALAFAAAKMTASALPWRLPHALEREKAARGVDGRLLPWGDFYDPTLANVLKGREGAPSPMATGAIETDASVYGVRDLVGNVKDLCLNDYAKHGATDGTPLRVEAAAPVDTVEVRGGGWASGEYFARSTARLGIASSGRHNTLGFRLAASYPPPR